MTELLFKKGLESSLPVESARTDGTFYVTTDTSKIVLGSSVWQDTNKVKEEIYAEIIKNEKTTAAALTDLENDKVEVETFNTTIDEINERLDNFTSSDVITNLNNDVSANTESIKTLTGDVNTLTTEVNTLTGKVNTLETSIENKAEISAVTKIQNELNTITSGSIEAFDTFKEVSDWIDQHEDEFATLSSLTQNYATKTTVEELSGKVATNTTNIEKNTASITANTSSINTLTENLNKLDQDVDSLTTTVDNLSAEMIKNEKTTAAALTDLENTKLEIVDYEASVNELNNEISNKASITELDELKLRVDNIDGGSSSENGSIKDINNRIDILSGSITSLTETVETLEETVSGKASQNDLDVLEGVVDSKASQSDLDALESVVNGKADISAVTAVNDRINDITSGADLNYDTFREVSDWIETHEDEFEVLSSMTKDYATKTSVEELSGKVTTNTTNIGTNTANITSLTNSFNALDGELTDLSQTVTNLANVVSDNEIVTAAALTDLENTKVEIADYEAKVSDLETSINSKVSTSDYNAKITEINDSLTNKAESSSISGLSNKIDTVSGSVNSLTTVVNSKADASAVTAVNERINLITSGADEAFDTFLEVNNWIQTHEEEFATLSSMTKDYATKDELQDVNTIIEDNELVIASSLTELDDRIKDIETLLNTIQESINNLNDRISALES